MVYPPKNKYLICISVERRLFFAVNSNPVKKASPDSQLEVANYEMPTLWKAASYVDTSELLQLPYDDIAPAERGDGNACRGPLSPTLRRRIKDCVLAHGLLPGWQEQLVREGL